MRQLLARTAARRSAAAILWFAMLGIEAAQVKKMQVWWYKEPNFNSAI
jgi:hypothetical protein